MKLYRQRKDTYVRVYDNTGYVCSTGHWTDRVVNDSGAVFLSALSRTPQSLDELVDKIHPVFINVERDIINADAEEFFDMLVQDGFLVSGATEEEMASNETGFSYKTQPPVNQVVDRTPAITRADSDTQEMLQSFFKDQQQYF